MKDDLIGMGMDILRAASDPTPPRTDLSQVPKLPRSAFGMSNFDGTIDPELEADLKAGKIGSHTAWDFNGQVWFADGQFHEEVWVHRVPRKVHSAPTLRALMDEVNGEWGND